MKKTTEETFQQDVLEKEFVIVDFFADWCGPCRMISPVLEEIQSELNIDIVMVNIDESAALAAQNEVMSIPTLLVFKNGKRESANIGAASKARLVDWIKAHQ